ncbi:MAG: DUF72 domain-containing protein [Planctomycetota bacterium]
MIERYDSPMSDSPQPIRAGTSGLCLSQGEYERAFSVVELQTKFFQSGGLAGAQRWRAQTPPGFEFVLRAPPAITQPEGGTAPRRGRHRRDTRHVDAEAFRDTPGVRRVWKDTLELVNALEAPMVIFKSPATFRATDENIANACRFFQWAHRDRMRLGWELLGHDWTDEIVRELCRELSLTHVVDPFRRPTMRGRPPCFRLNGIGGPHHHYSDDELAQLRDWCTGDRSYCIFGNGSRREDARRFLEMAMSESS